jgi:putative ATP-dependent endonuclease of the OLD family
MTVVRVFLSQGGASRYYGMTLRHPAFQQIRAIEKAQDRRTAFMAIPRTEIYADLPAVSNADQLAQAMDDWEQTHLDQCVSARDDGQFLGFSNVGRGSLTKYISFVFVPAVRDAIADAVDGRGSVISQLIEILVRNVINQKEEILAWQKKASDEYKDLTSPEKIGELNDLSEQLNETLRVFYTDAGLDLRWLPIEDLKISLPTASVELLEQGFIGPLEGKGHGLQRAFIFTILQHLAHAIFAHKAEPEELEGPMPAGNLILAIEEPELYQHPTKQKHLAGVLRAISSGTLPGVMSATQLLVCSHSPHFVSTDNFDEVRLARRICVDGSPSKECVVTDIPYQKVLDGLNAARGPVPGGWQQDSLKARLHTLNAEVAEGFFALKVVLVEGAGDQAAILAIANAHGFDLSAHGIAVVPVSGKNNLDKTLLIFRGLGIPTYVIWDNDLQADDNTKLTNIALFKINGIENPVDFGTQVTPRFACFDSKLETVLRHEIGADFDKKIGEIGYTLAMKAKELIKNPVGLSQVLRRCYRDNNRSATMDSIVYAIQSL